MKLISLFLLACIGGLSGWFAAGTLSSEGRQATEPSTTSSFRVTPLTRSSSTLSRSQLPSAAIERRISLEHWARRDPEGALAAVLDAIGSDSKTQRIADLTTVFTIWADDNLQEAIRGYMRARSAFELRESERGAVFQALAASDPENALSFMRQMGISVGDAVWEYELTVAALARLNPREAMQRAIEFQEIYEREETLSPDRDYLNMDRGGFVMSSRTIPTFQKAVLEEWIRKDSPEAMAWLRDNAISSIDSNSVMQTVIDNDPAFAATLIAQSLAGKEAGNHYQTLSKLGAQWSKHDAEASLKWINEVAASDTELRRPFLNGVIRTLSELGEFQNAVEVFSGMINEQDDPFRHDTPHMLLSQWSTTDPESALNWAKSLPESMRNEAVAEVLGRWARQDRAAASEHFHLVPEDMAEHAFLNGDPIVRSANIQTSEEARALIREPGMASRASNLALALAKRAPVEASLFISQEIEHLKNPEAAEHTVYQWADEDPQAAGEWARTLPAEWRKPALRQLMTVWSRLDESGARQWMETLPETLRQEAEQGVGVPVDNTMIITIGP